MQIDGKRVLELAVKAGEVLLRNGAEIFRVQETMMKISGAFGVPSIHVYVVSNGIFASLDECGETHSTEIRHIPLSPVHLGRVSAVNQLSREIVQGRHTLDSAFTRLNEIDAIPFAPGGIKILASGVGSACFCYLLGGYVDDSLISFLSGTLLYCFILLAGKKQLSKIITHILGSALVTFCGLLCFQIGLGSQMDKIIIGSIIPLVPGVSLTTSIRDFFNSDYLSGTIRLIDAVLIASCIAIGVGFALRLAQWTMGVRL